MELHTKVLWLLGVLVLVGLSWLYTRWQRVRRFWAERGVPHTPPNPVLGSLAFLRYENPSEWMRRQIKVHPEPYFGMWCFWKPALVVQSPELARRVLVKDADVFRDRFLSSGTSDPIGALNVFTVNDPLWTTVRRKLTAAFTAAKLRAVQPLLEEKTADLLDRIRRDYLDGKNSDKLSLKDLYADYTTDIISTAAFGLEGHATRTGDSPMRAITKEFSTYRLSRTAAWISIFFAPYLVNPFGFTFFPKKATDFFRDVFTRIVAQRGGWEAGAKDTEKRDLVDVLLRLRQGDTDSQEITEDVVLAQAAIFLQGGFETTAVALSFMTYELAYNPHIQERLFDELNEARSQGKLDPKNVVDLPYLSSVIKEILRVYPAMGWLDRIAGQDYKVDDKLTIPRGTPVYVNAVGMHFSPEYFPDPFKFDPDRFLPENEGNIKPYSYMPFGDGPRNCIGMRFAQQTLRYVVPALVLKYQFKPLDGAPLPSEVGIDNKALFLTPGRRLAVRFVPRA